MQNRIIIKGAGLQGLTAAYCLRDQNPIVYEAQEKAGGWIQTKVVDNFLFEQGPRGFRPKGEGLFTLRLIRELGLEDELITPPKSAEKRYIYRKGKLEAIPHSLKSLFSPMGKVIVRGILQDLVMPKKMGLETIHDYFSYRFGSKFTNVLVDSGISGIFAGDIKELSLKQCFPEVYQTSTANRSLTLGMLRRKAAEKDYKWSKYPVISFKRGMSTLIDALAAHVDVRTKSPIEHSDIDCTQGHSAASIAVVNLGYKKKVLPVAGFGYLVPIDQNEPILGCVFDSEIFPQQNRHPEETRLTVMLGGVHQPQLLNHPNLIELVQKTLYRHIGIKIEPDAASITLCKDAIPQYRVNDSLQGVGINDACRKGYEKGFAYAHSTPRTYT